MSWAGQTWIAEGRGTLSFVSQRIYTSPTRVRITRALEMLDATLRGIEQGKIDGSEAIDILLKEELSLQENRKIKAALRMARLPIIKCR